MSPFSAQWASGERTPARLTLQRITKQGLMDDQLPVLECAARRKLVKELEE